MRERIGTLLGVLIVSDGLLGIVLLAVHLLHAGGGWHGGFVFLHALAAVLVGVTLVLLGLVDLGSWTREVVRYRTKPSELPPLHMRRGRNGDTWGTS